MEDKNEEIWNVGHKDEETENYERNDKGQKCSIWGLKLLIMDSPEGENNRKKIPGAEENMSLQIKRFLLTIRQEKRKVKKQ